MTTGGADGYRLEAELYRQTPRHVRPRMGARFNRFVLGLVTIGFPSLFVYLAWNAADEWAALRDHGKPTTGEAVELIPGRDGRKGYPPSARFEYQAGRRRERVKLPISPGEYGLMKLGDERELVYLPEQPTTAVMKDDLERNSGTKNAISYGFAALFTFSLGAGGLIYTERRRALRRNLAENGAVAATSALRFPTIERGQGNSIWTLEYVFEHHGKTYGNTLRIGNRTAEKLREPGARTTILFDLRDPRRNLPYFLVVETYRIS